MRPQLTITLCSLAAAASFGAPPQHPVPQAASPPVAWATNSSVWRTMAATFGFAHASNKVPQLRFLGKAACNVKINTDPCPGGSTFSDHCYSIGTCMETCGGGQTCTEHNCNVKPNATSCSSGGQCQTEGTCMAVCGGGIPCPFFTSSHVSARAPTPPADNDRNVKVNTDPCPEGSPFGDHCYSIGTCMETCGGGQTCTEHNCNVRPSATSCSSGGQCQTEGTCMDVCGGGVPCPSSTTSTEGVGRIPCDPYRGCQGSKQSPTPPDNDCNVKINTNPCPEGFPFSDHCHSIGTCMETCGGGQTCTEHNCNVKPSATSCSSGGQCQTEGTCVAVCGGGVPCPSQGPVGSWNNVNNSDAMMKTGGH